MPWLILGVSVLIALILAARWFVSADPKLLARVLKWGTFGVLTLVAVFFAFTGRLALALPFAILLLPLARSWLRRRLGLVPGGGFGVLEAWEVLAAASARRPHRDNPRRSRPTC